MSKADSFTEWYWNAVHTWARALANIELSTSEKSTWTCFEMGVREALFSVSMDLGWSDDEWEAVEAG